MEADRPDTVTPHLVCRNAAGAIAFYKTAFGAVELFRLTGDDGLLQLARIRIGRSELMLLDENPARAQLGPLALGGSPVTLHLQVADTDVAMARAVTAGATITLAADDMYWGERYGRIEDPFGHHWEIACRTRLLSPQQLAAEASPATGDD